HRALAGALLTKRTLLAGPEIRFLRELCAWDATRLAALIDVTPVSLSRWENDQMGHSGMADRLIRMLAAEALGLAVPRNVLEHIGDAALTSRVALRFGPSGWRVVDESDPVSVWISFAEEDREAVLRALEASLESLKAIVLSACEDPGRALRVAVDALRALRPTPARPETPDAHVEP